MGVDGVHILKQNSHVNDLVRMFYEPGANDAPRPRASRLYDAVAVLKVARADTLFTSRV